MKGLGDKVVLVTGAGGGMGTAICKRFVEEGAKVAVFDVDADAARRVLAQLPTGRAHMEVVDITRYTDVERAVQNTEAALGSVDILVNNAGWDRFSLFLDTDEALREKVVAVNLFGPINMHHAVLKGMKERGRGRIITIASDAARVGSTGQAVYAACKGGMISFMKTIAREMVRYGILTNCICPGPTETPMLASLLDEGETGRKVHGSLVRAIPMGRLGRPDDIPGIVVFLSGDDSSFITGQVISVSGGLTMAG